ncbi:MAG: sugar phosphate isomerase/epimerase [Desulfobulbaceae bacterium]|nr:sugar phosphate isomerase/epimerase [Desulfobulbaceae bacterium]
MIDMSRREFIVASATGVGTMATSSFANCGSCTASHKAKFKTKLFKSLITGVPNEKLLEKLKKAGFDGIECGAGVNIAKAEATRKLTDKHGMRIHSLIMGWMNFDQATKVNADIANVQRCLATAGAYGVDALLLVPCKIGGKMPQPWEFDIEFDEKTGHIEKVVKGDNTPYQTYIDQHNKSADASRIALRRLIPAAKKAGVVVAVENVWNNMWVKPEIFAHFIKSCDSKWIQTYFDIGNHVVYAPSEDWIKALGKTIVKCHVKDFKLNKNGQGGDWANFRDGSVNWPAVRKELDKLEKDMWMTVEGNRGLSLEEKSNRLDLIAQGK